MLLQGSCHCQRVRFRVHCSNPYPFLLCYCSICRKTEGASWVRVQAGPNDRRFDEYPDESLAEWHRPLGLEDSDA